MSGNKGDLDVAKQNLARKIHHIQYLSVDLIPIAEKWTEQKEARFDLLLQKEQRGDFLTHSEECELADLKVEEEEFYEGLRSILNVFESLCDVVENYNEELKNENVKGDLG